MATLKREFGFLGLVAALFGFNARTGAPQPIFVQPVYGPDPKPSDTFPKGYRPIGAERQAGRSRGFHNPVSGRWMIARTGKPPVNA